MKKLKLFIENFLVYGLSGVISKIIPVIMVPVITRLMPNAEYFGLNDLSGTVVSFCGAFALMGMYDAMYRLFFEKSDEQYRKDICSTALIFALFTSFVIAMLLVLFRQQLAAFIFQDRQYGYLVYLTAMSTLIGSTNNIVSAPTRMQNKRTVFVVMNTIIPILSYAISVPMLLKGYYVIALPLSGVISAIANAIVFGILNHKWFSFRNFKKKYLKELLLIGVPLLPNFLIYWVFNSSDKLMIAALIGTGFTGIYAVGSKLGHLSQLIYMAFAGGWQYFAFSTMNDGDQVGTNSKVFEYLGILSFACSAFIFAWSKSIFQFLFTGDYTQGYIVSGYLFLAPLLQMLFQVACNQFLVIKKTWPNAFILLTGALINVALNLLLIPKIGIEGAAIATLAGYALSDIVGMAVLCKMKLMRVTKRFLCACVLITIYIVIWRFCLIEHSILATALASAICAIYFVMYRKDLFSAFSPHRKTT